MKKIKLPLEMANGVLVRTLDELKENWDLEKVLNYYLNGKLQTWLTDRYYTELAEEVSALNGINDNTELQKKLCNIFSIEAENDLVDLEAVAERNRRLEILRHYTADDVVLKNVDKVAFNQKELKMLLNKGETVIYLYNNKYSIPLSLKNKKYVGIGDVEIQVNSKEFIDFVKLGIEFFNVHFNKEYEKFINSSDSLYKRAEKLEKAGKYDEALKLYRTASLLGSVDALLKLGDFYQYGKKNIDIDLNLAIECYEKARDLGSSLAMDKLGDMYYDGKGVNQNYSKAIEYYKEAAKLGFNKSMAILGKIYFEGLGVIKDYSEAAKWLKQAAELGNVDAMYLFGNMYRKGLGVDKDVEKALFWLKKVANLSNSNAMYDIGIIYFYERGVNIDYKEGLKWLKKAANLNNNVALNYIGMLYLKGSVVEKNYNEAIYFFEKAKKLGNKDALNNIGYMYQYGYGVEKDIQKAVDYYKEANISTSLSNIAYIYLNAEIDIEPNYKKALEWFKKAADLGNANAMLKIGEIYQAGYYNRIKTEYEIQQDEIESLRWFKKAADLGNADAMWHIGHKYSVGSGVKENELEAWNWYRKAADLGNGKAMSSIALYYQYGVEPVKQDYREALKWYKKAVEHGNEASKRNVYYLEEYLNN